MANRVATILGIGFLLVGILGFVFGTGADRMLTIIAGQLELGTVDHIIHVVLGGVYLIGGLATSSVPATRTA